MRKKVILASVLLCLASAFIPAIKIVEVGTGATKETPLGCMAPIASCLCAGHPAPLANITFLAAAVILWERYSATALRWARGLLAVSFLLGISFLLIYNLAVWGDEGGVTRVYLRPYYGYFLWLGSFVLCAIATLVSGPSGNKDPSLCPRCGYDIRASTHACPGCGEDVPNRSVTLK